MATLLRRILFVRAYLLAVRDALPDIRYQARILVDTCYRRRRLDVHWPGEEPEAR